MSSSTGSGLPSGETNVLVTWETSMMAAGPCPLRPLPRWWLWSQVADLWEGRGQHPLVQSVYLLSARWYSRRQNNRLTITTNALITIPPAMSRANFPCTDAVAM